MLELAPRTDSYRIHHRPAVKVVMGAVRTLLHTRRSEVFRELQCKMIDFLIATHLVTGEQRDKHLRVQKTRNESMIQEQLVLI